MKRMLKTMLTMVALIGLGLSLTGCTTTNKSLFSRKDISTSSSGFSEELPPSLQPVTQ